jgi:hypothetical protein
MDIKYVRCEELDWIQGTHDKAQKRDGSYERGDESSCSINGVKYCNQLSDYHLAKYFAHRVSSISVS